MNLLAAGSASEPDKPAPGDLSPTDALSPVLIHLLKGVVYQDSDPKLWSDLLDLQARARDYVSVLGLELTIDEAEGYAFLRSRPDDGDKDTSAPEIPRLIARRPLSFPVSLLLALLRKKLVEFDAAGGETRLILSREEILELVRVFLPDSSNEARLIDQIERHINKIVELGFLRRLRPSAGAKDQSEMLEVRRILKAFVDAQWLSEFDARLGEYQAQLGGEPDPDAKSGLRRPEA